jgi:hypothetical protein
MGPPTGIRDQCIELDWDCDRRRSLADRIRLGVREADCGSTFGSRWRCGDSLMIAMMIIIYTAFVLLLFKVMRLRPTAYLIASLIVAGVLLLAVLLWFGRNPRP